MWNLVWADEFDRDGPPDPANWIFEKGFVRNRELQWYQPENARCEGGLLIIEARRERVKNPEYDPTSGPASGDWKKDREFAEYTSASLMTQGLHQWKYGRFEMRARINPRPGLWPAFWTLGVDGEWPKCGEIDIMENYRETLLANVAWGTKERWTPRWSSVRTPLESLGGWDWANRFHTWRMDWDESSIKLSVDDQLLNAVDLSTTRNEDEEGENPFHQPHFILLSLAVGGTNGGDPTATQFPARLEVDYVRVYQASRG